MASRDNVLRRDEAAQRRRIIDGISYEIDLDLTTGDTTFASATTVKFTCAEPGASTFIDITAPAVHTAVLNGRTLPTRAFDGNRLQLDRLDAENELEVVAEAAYVRTGQGLHRFVDPTDQQVYLHSQFEPFDAHRVFACFDQPDLKGTARVAVTAPDDWTVFANEPGTDDGRGRWTFGTTKPMSSYLVVVVAGPYRRFESAHGDIPLALGCRQSLAEYLDIDDIVGLTRQGLDYFSALFDFPYPFTKYDQVFVPEFAWGAMENPGCVTFSEGYIFRSAITETQREMRAGTILHEMAHMWFGDLVTMRWWDDLWLNESFATYMANRSAAEATRFTQAWSRFASVTKAAAYLQDQLPSTHPISADIVDTEALRLAFDGITYSKGASVVRQLAAWVGQDAFDAGLRDYFQRHKWGNADLHDFLHALEKPSGRDLGTWAAEWLQTAGVNVLRPELTVDGGTVSSFAVTQTAVPEHPQLRSHRIAIGLYTGEEGGPLTRVHAVEVDVSGPRTEVGGLVGVTAPELVVVNDGDLTYAKIRLDERSLQAAEARLSDVADPMARSLCWNALWDMVRDAELPARRFARLVLAHLGGEPDLGAASRLFDRAREAVMSFGDTSHRADGRALLAHFAKARLDEAAPSGDAQRIWASAWIALVDAEDDMASLERLLDGDDAIEGLAVDVDLRWAAIEALTARGGRDPRLIELEVDRDPTDIGRRRAVGLRAAVPDAAAKEQAWALATTDDSTALQVRTSAAVGMRRLGQVELLRPYVARYFAELPDLWRRFDREVATSLTRSLYPGSVVEEATAAATDAALASSDLGPVVRRILLEQADTIRRSLRAQAVDRDAPDS